MDKMALRQLFGARGWTVEELRQKNPRLATQVAALVGDVQRRQLVAAVAELPEPARARVTALDLSRVSGDLRAVMRTELHGAGVEASRAAAVAERVTVASFDGLAGEARLAAEPVLAQQLALARVFVIGDIAGLGDTATADVAAQAPAVAALDDATLSRMVTDGALTHEQAKAVGLAAALLSLVDDNVPLATAIRAAAFPALGNVAATEVTALASLTAADWHSFFASATDVLPAGVTAVDLAATLTERFAVLSPSIAFARRLPRMNADQIAAALGVLSEVYARNVRVVGVEFGKLDVSEVVPDRLDSVKARHAELATLARSYPGLEIAAVLDDATNEAVKRASSGARRIDLVHQVFERPADRFVLERDLSRPATALLASLRDGSGATELEAELVLATLQAYQRIWVLAQGVDRAHTLIGRGFSTSLSIGALGFRRFAGRSGLEPDPAKLVWERARGMMADVALTAGAILDVARGSRGGLAVADLAPAVTGELTRLAGFEEMFGNLALCACTECQSIVGPAAYFVDLMKYIDDHLRVAFSAVPGHPLDLQTRRPDLWTLPLTCDNTNRRVATLDLVAEVLENYIAIRAGYQGPLTERTAIGALVYEQTLASAVDSVNQPFELPYARVDAYLSALGSSRAECAKAVAAPSAAELRATLGLSAKGYALIATADADLSVLSHIYGIAFAGTPTAIDQVDAADLARGLGVARSQLGELVATTLVATVPGSIKIIAGKRDAHSVQNDIEWVTGLTASSLDRIVRVTRLLRELGWSAAQLDLACTTLGASDLTSAVLDDLARLVALQVRLGSDLSEVCALCTTTGGRALARRLGVSAEDMRQLLALAGITVVSGVAAVTTLVELASWWRSTKYSLDDLALAVGVPVRDPSRFLDPSAIAAQTAAAAVAGLKFADTVFSVALGISEQGSRDIIAANPTLFEPASGGWRLAAGVDVETVTISTPATALVPTPPAGTRSMTAAEARAVLRPHVPLEAVAGALAVAFGVTTDKLVAVARLGGQIPLSPAVLAAVRGDGALAPLVALVDALRPLLVAFADPAWDADAIDFARSHPDRFAQQPLPHLDLHQLEGLAAYAELARHASPAVVRDALLAFDGTSFPPAAEPTLASALGADQALISSLRPRVGLPTNAMAALAQLGRATRLARELAIDGDTLVAISGDAYMSLAAAADALLLALDAKQRDAAEQPVREAKRDALAEWLLRSVSPAPWRSMNELYEYFLIDVAAGGCSTTSRVVSATTSAQLYVHRVLMNLENDGLAASDPSHIVLHVPEDAAAEWIWRKTYRVWQANRTVFLWPENYLEPDLRDDKTPLFVELEQELLQTDITDQNVLDAYTKYLAGFEEVASLTLAGAYHQIGASSDVLHLFGVSTNDPPTYYYRTCENLRASRRDPTIAPLWSAWQKLTVQITGRKVSPVVHRGRLHLFWTDVKTKPSSRVANGSSEFAGYAHTLSLRYTTLRPDGAWTTPQSVQVGDRSPFGPSRGQIFDPVMSEDGPGYAMLDPSRRVSADAIDDYTLSGPNWDWCWLTSASTELRIQFRDYLEKANVDLFGRKTTPASWPATPSPYPQLLCARTGAASRPLYAGTPWFMFWPVTGYANAVIDERHLDTVELDSGGLKAWFLLERFNTQIASLPPTAELLAIPGAETDALVQVGNDLLYLDSGARDDAGYVLARFGTTLVESIARRLFEEGLDSVLDTQTQLDLAEAGVPFNLVAGRVTDRTNTGKLDFAGPYGVYYRELYFHIPYLIANALHSRGRFEAAQRWYHYIFDPTATEVIDVANVAPGEVAHRLLDRVWRYRELRGLDLAHIRDLLSDPAALDLYKRDPFNPWAIARRRPSAVQQAVVMKYVANLLDWADSLFAQFTMESVNEALLLYMMASGVLGNRPRSLGDCGAEIGTDAAPNYGALAPRLVDPGSLLVEIETWMLGARAFRAPRRGSATTTFGVTSTAISAAIVARRSDLSGLGTRFDAIAGVSDSGATPTEVDEGKVFRGFGWRATRTSSWGPALGNATVKTRDPAGGRSFEHAWKSEFAASAGGFAFNVLQLAPVFCLPGNTTLLGLWDRIEDRLFKIRHCQDLEGHARTLALFAPPLDPADLIAMAAAGLGLEDVLAAGTGNLPPYRFSYLIDRAKAYAGLLGGLGSALLGAFEKRDGEHLNRVRMTQQLNLAQMTTQVLRLDLQVASEILESVEQQRASVEYRRDYYANLIADGRSGWELAESMARHTSSGLRALEGTLGFISAVTTLLPDVGSPFAMKYGGVAVGGHFSRWARSTGTLAALADGVAASAGFEGSMARRTDGWRHQRALADFELKSLDRQRTATQLRVNIATRALATHEKTLEQQTVISELTDGRFTNLGLYTWLSAQLRQSYRAAYQNTLAIANLAERAYRFERGEDAEPALAATYWDTARGGLLAGERILVDLQTLERRYLETNYRTLELDQAFSLSQLDAVALLELRETGSCVFTASEAFFDLFYPGHYKRRIKAVRLTVPCITGPYVNVGATLELDQSWMRVEATAGVPLVEVPPSRSVSIATSTAQNDGGVFELSFRDERYMPFEGLGAISRWRLSLPKAFRQFDYQTINDVVLSISYTAEHDAALRDRVESDNASLEGSIVEFFSNHPARRVFSLRQDFSSAFTRLVRSAAETPVKFEISDRSLPLVFTGRAVRVTRAALLLRTALGASTVGCQFSIDGTLATNFAPDPSLGGLSAADLSAAFTAELRGNHTIEIKQAGGLAPQSVVPGEVGAVDVGRLLDALLYFEYVLA